MIFRTFKEIKSTPNINFTNDEISLMHNGLFRCEFSKASELMPELKELFDSSPIMKGEESEWEIDVKVHMLMRGQYPCIPNWHCDYVPRVDGRTDYSYQNASDKDNNYPMFLWLSGEPLTEFMEIPLSIEGKQIKSHGDLARSINLGVTNQDWGLKKAPEKTWLLFDNKTPHRGTICQKNTWRIFVRLVHKTMTPQRPKTSEMRRHSQVYLDAEYFNW